MEVTVGSQNGMTEGDNQSPQDGAALLDDIPSDLIGYDDRETLFSPSVHQSCLASTSASGVANYTSSHCHTPLLKQIRQDR